MSYKKENWFEDWFDSKYYHLLYQNRDKAEATLFISNLVKALALPKEADVLDLACGKGRHSISLNQHGFRVTGMDLSENSIMVAQKNSTETLQFKAHDMRVPFGMKFDAVVNLFTSFGYFDNDEADQKVIDNIGEALNPNGQVVIDYLNVNKAIAHLKHKETKIISGIQFDIQKRVKDGFIEKQINFTGENQREHEHTERVKCIDLNRFKELFNNAGLTFKACFGDYHLTPFDPETSDRCIVIAHKNN